MRRASIRRPVASRARGPRWGRPDRMYRDSVAGGATREEAVTALRARFPNFIPDLTRPGLRPAASARGIRSLE